MSKIPNVKEIQKIRDEAKSSAEVGAITAAIISDVTCAASRGESSVIMSGNDFVLDPRDINLQIACNNLLDEGYKICRYNGSETEDTCFGTGYVSVTGIKVSW